MTLVIDQLMRLSEEAPRALLLPNRTGPEWGPQWMGLTNMRAWILSGSIASWLIAQGYGPGDGTGNEWGGKTLTVPRGDSPQRVALLLGALRAGALVVEGPLSVSYGALSAASIDAAVAERRTHIDESTPARRVGERVRCHGDFKTIEEAVSG